MRTIAALALVALAVAGCGGADPPSDEDQVRTAISDYAEAVGGDGKPEDVCDLIVSARGKLPPKECRARIRRSMRNQIRVGLPVRVRSVRVRGNTAAATMDDGERTRLLRVDGSWRIVAPG